MIFVSHRIPVSEQLQTVSKYCSLCSLCVSGNIISRLFLSFPYKQQLVFLILELGYTFYGVMYQRSRKHIFYCLFPKKGQPSGQCGHERFGLLVQSQDP